MSSPIGPLQIGPIRIETAVFLAPMSGVTDLAFRRLVKRAGAGLVTSEMIASQAMVRANRRSLQKAANVPEEYPMAVQLAGCEPQVMAQAARLNQDRGAAIIDVNMGCPVKKVVGGHAGSALMRDERLAGRILEATVKAVELPVTLKMRSGWDEHSRNAPRLARIAEDCGVRMVTVHGRTRCQLYKGAADWRFVAEVKDSSKKTRLLEFEFNTDQAYVLEFGEEYLRFFRNNDAIKSGDTDAVITNGTFDSDIVGWTDISSGTGTISHNAGNTTLSLNGAGGGNEGRATQSVAIGVTFQGNVHVLAFRVFSGTLDLKIGTSSGGTEILGPITMETHSSPGVSRRAVAG